MKTAAWILIVLLALSALLFVPDGKILWDAQNEYFIGEEPHTHPLLRPYGAMLAVGAICALTLCAALYLHKKTEKSPGKLGRFLAFAAGSTGLGALFSRVVYCVVMLDFYWGMAGFAAALRWWEGGMAMTGALLGTALSAHFVWKNDPSGYEATAITLPVMLFLARIGERFTTIGQGMDVEFDGVFALPGDFGNVLNVWRIEAIVALALLLVMFLWRRLDAYSPRGAGYLAAFFVFYGAVQILMESLRGDQHLIWSFVKAQQLFSFLMAFFCLMTFSWSCGRRAASFIASALLAGGVFALEKALDRLSVPDQWLYLLFVLLVAGYLAFAVSVMRRNQKMKQPTH